MRGFSDKVLNVSSADAPSIANTHGWHSRGYLPHFDGGPIPQNIAFRLIDSLPSVKLREWAEELANIPTERAEDERRHRIDEYLDRGLGELWLSRPAIAELVQHSLLQFDRRRYYLHAWVVMPNHVHALITPVAGSSLSQILHTWKSYTAKKANDLLERKGAFWQQEYFDRYVRHEAHFEDAVKYIEFNPVKAGLCTKPQDWRFSSAAWRSLKK